MYIIIGLIFSAGYECVKSQLVSVIHLLKATKHARKALTLHYKQEGWLEMTEYPTEDELVTQALVRMKNDSSQYDTFIQMLNTIQGLDMIVKAITYGHGKIVVQCSYTHTNLCFMLNAWTYT